MKTALAASLLWSLTIFSFLGASSLAPPTSPASSEQIEASSDSNPCPPLPPATGVAVNVSTVSQFQDALEDPVPDTTILIADGTYALGGTNLQIAAPGITLRSASGSRTAVVLICH